MDLTFVSADGTTLRGWQGPGEGPAVLICNGLGATPLAWPGLVGPDSGYRVLTWYQRGTFGSARPDDPRRIRVEDHVADAVALLDASGLDRVLVVAWSVGVNMAFELARLHPDRVRGVLAVAGVPGGTFATMGGPLRVPRRLRRPLALATARAGRTVGPALTWLAPKVPVTPRLSWLLAHTGFMLPGARPEVLTPMLQEFLHQDWHWYGELALAADQHGPMDLGFLRAPVTFVAGRHDVMTSMHDMTRAAALVPHAELSILPGSHFLPLEHPDQITTALRDLTARVEAHETA